MEMFDSEVKFYGKHALFMKKYSKDHSGDSQVSFEVDNMEGEIKKITIFDTMIQCYMVCGLLGIINKRKADIDNDKSTSATIFGDAFRKNRTNCMRVFQHMVLSSENSLSSDAKIKQAFSVSLSDEEKKEYQKELEDYVRGGLEIINEMFESCKTYEDVANVIYQLKDNYTL